MTSQIKHICRRSMRYDVRCVFDLDYGSVKIELLFPGYMLYAYFQIISSSCFFIFIFLIFNFVS